MTAWIVVFVFLFIFGTLHWKFPYFFRSVRLTVLRGHWTANPYDLDDFSHRRVDHGERQVWPENLVHGITSPAFNRQLSDLKTSAFLVAQNGELIYEKYFGEHRVDTLSNSFSMAKTVMALLAGKAVEEGHLESLDVRISSFFPKYQYTPADQVTIRDLIRMSSGMEWREHYYLPFNETTDAYYGKNLEELILSRKIVETPGKKFAYQSGNTQLLGMILSKVIPGTMSSYLSQHFWKPLGMEYPAFWTVDESSGIEKCFCCIHATARDFLKIGQLFLQNGRWNDHQVISTAFAEEMRQPGFPASPQYGSGLWLDYHHSPPFYLMRGHLGQYVIIIPSREMVICRVGRKYLKTNSPPKLEPEDIYTYVNAWTRDF